MLVFGSHEIGDQTRCLCACRYHFDAIVNPPSSAIFADAFRKPPGAKNNSEAGAGKSKTGRCACDANVAGRDDVGPGPPGASRRDRDPTGEGMPQRRKKRFDSHKAMQQVAVVLSSRP